MFSLIKTIQDMFGKLKKNKGLFFTTLTALSVGGIALFMTLILNMTSDVKEKVYESIAQSYTQKLNNVLDYKKQLYLTSANTILNNGLLLDAIEQNNKGYLETQINILNTLYKQNNNKSLLLNIYPVLENTATVRSTISSTLRSKNQIFGLEIQQEGVYITLIKPIISKGKFIGLIEIKESVDSLKNDFDASDNNFVFLLNKKMLVKLSLKAKSGKYKNVTNDYSVLQASYSSRFYSKITDAGEDKFTESLKKSFDSDEVYFRTYRIASDINGADIGMYVIGEQVEKNNGFVNIADNMVKSVTYISLGLVVSILLFMF